MIAGEIPQVDSVEEIFKESIKKGVAQLREESNGQL